MLKVSRLLATGLEILVANAKFSVALATSWSQFRTLLSLKPSQPIHCKSSCHLVALFDLSCALSIFRGHHLVVNIHTVVTQCEISVTRKKRVYLGISSGYFLYFSIRTLWKHILVWSFFVMLLIFTLDTSIL